MIKYLTKEDNFNDIINEEKILIDFYADWCGPCRMLGPILEKQNKINVVKINVDEFPDIATKYGIMSIPTMIIFSKGKEIRKEIGFKSEEEINEIVSAI